MNGSVDRLVSDYEVIKVAFKARKAAERLQSTSRKPRASPVKKQRPSTASKDSTAPPGARKRPPTDSPAKKPAAKRQKQNHSSASKVRMHILQYSWIKVERSSLGRNAIRREIVRFNLKLDMEPSWTLNLSRSN